MRTNKSGEKFGDFYQRINSSQFLPRSGKSSSPLNCHNSGKTPHSVSSALVSIWERNGDKMNNKRDEKGTWKTGGKEKN
jgi:hypothetical protein